MKKSREYYVSPTAEIIVFSSADIITLSGGGTENLAEWDYIFI